MNDNDHDEKQTGGKEFDDNSPSADQNVSRDVKFGMSELDRELGRVESIEHESLDVYESQDAVVDTVADEMAAPEDADDSSVTPVAAGVSDDMSKLATVDNDSSEQKSDGGVDDGREVSLTADDGQAVEVATIPEVSEDAKSSTTLDDIIARHAPEPKVRKPLPVIWIIIVVVLLGVAGVLGWLYYSQKDQQLGNLQRAQDDLRAEQSKAESLQKDLATSKKKLAETIDASQKASEEAKMQANIHYREIAEWGVRYKVSDANRGLSYAYVPSADGTTSIKLTAANIISLEKTTGDEVCGPGVLGVITRYTKAQIDMAKTAATKLNQGALYDAAVKVDGSYYLFIKPQSAPQCSEAVDKKLVASASVAAADFVKAFESIPTK